MDSLATLVVAGAVVDVLAWTGATTAVRGGGSAATNPGLGSWGEREGGLRGEANQNGMGTKKYNNSTAS